MKLTKEALRKIIQEEASKLNSEELKDETPSETDPDELADSVEKHVDFIKALKIKEAKLTAQLKKIQEAKAAATKKLLAKV